MSVVVAYVAAIALLGLAGALKLRDPKPAARMIGRLLPAGAPTPLRRPDTLLLLARGVGVGELLLAVTALTTGSAVAGVGVGVAYLVFAAVAEAGRRGGAESCGCLGGDDVPPGPRHVLVDVLLAAGSFASVTATAPIRLITSGSGAACLLLGVLLAGLLRLVLTSAATLASVSDPA